MTDAIVTGSGATPCITLERRLADPPEVVWRALTEPEQLVRWFPCRVEVEGGRWEKGRAIDYRYESMELRLTGQVLTVDEPWLLEFTWGEETLRFELEADGRGSRLVLTDTLPAPYAARNAAGWEVCLDRLQGVEPPREWQPRFDFYSNAFEPVVGAQEGPPAGHR